MFSWCKFAHTLGEIKGKMSKNDKTNTHDTNVVWVGLKVIRI